MNEIIRVCDKVLWIERGCIIQIGNASNIVGAYLLANDREERLHSDTEKREFIEGAHLRSVEICDVEGNVRSSFRTGESLIVHFDYEKDPEIEALTFSFAMTLGDEKNYVSCHSPWTGFVLRSHNNVGRVTLTIPQLLLNTGLYLLNVGIWNENFKHAYDWRWNFRHIEIRNDSDYFTGRFFLPHSWSESSRSGSPEIISGHSTSR
jgi:lipopolysaccharide transport system ATP-binding protein